jgi:threo-3-hydroxy-L-aspartate ammonia-lyase
MDLADVEAAARRLEGVARRTPVFTSSTLDRLLGATCFLKAESFQRTGAFKFRGAYNYISAMDPGERAKGLCTVSSGNHAQAVALSAALHRVPAIVAMPSDAPRLKVAAVRNYGAEVRPLQRADSQYDVADRITAETGFAYVSSHDHSLIAAGAGTAALELFADEGPLDTLVAPVGGGGGLSGYAVVAKAQSSPARVVGVEPTGSGLASASLAAGTAVKQPVPDTIADGLRLTQLGAFNFEIIREKVDQVACVSDRAIVESMRFLFERMKLVIEPSGACSLAGLLSGTVAVSGQRVGVILSGGNVSAVSFGDLMSSSSPS